MTEAARLVLIADTTSLAQGEQALNSLARTGGKVEGTLTINAQSIERAMARIGGVMGGLDSTMKALERAVSQSMGKTSQEVSRSAQTFDDLRRQIDPAYAASQRFAVVQADLARMVAEGAANQAQANDVLEIARSRYLGIATAAETAEQAQREQAAAVARATGSYEALRAAVDPVYAASKRYEAAQETLTAAVQQGIIKQAEMNRVLGMAERQFLAPASGLRDMGDAADQAGKGVARFAPQLTNASFQVQDFAVQVASGQSALIAFTQQFPQLAGSLGFSGTLALVGAGLGTLVAVGMAVAPMLLDLESSAKKAEKALEGLSDAVAAYARYTEAASASQIMLVGQFGSLAGEARRANEVMAQFARLDAINAMAEAVKNLTATFGGLSESKVFTRGGFMAEIDETYGNIRNQLQLTDQQARVVTESLYNLSQAKTMEDQVSAAVAFNDAMILAFGSLEKMPKELQAAARQALMLALSGAQVADENARAAEEQRKMRQAADDLIGSYDRQAAMSRLVAQHGTDSAQVEAMKREEAYRAAQALADQQGISGPLADSLVRSAMAAYDAAVGADQAAVALRNAEAAARSLAAALSAAAGFTGNLQNQIQIVQARIDAQRAGTDAAMAGQRRSMELQAEAHRQAMLDAGESEFAAQTAYLQQVALIDQLGTLTAEERTLAETRREGAKAGRSAAGEASKAAKQAARDSEKLSESLDKEAQRWRETLDPMVRYRREAAELAKLTGRLSKGEMAEAQRRLNIELADSLPLTGQLVDTISAGMLDGFGATLDGMGDALKKWLANAIAMAAKNRIIVAMGLGGVGGIAGGDALTSALGAAGAPTGGLMGAGGVMGGIASLGTAAMSAFTGGLQAAMGGIGSIAQYTTLMMGSATGSLAGLATAAGALAVPLLAVAGVFSFFRKKTKELDAGLRITVDGLETAVETFRKTETRRFWGLSKKTRTSYDAADQETQDALSSIVGNIQTGVMDAAAALGIGAETFAGFAHQMTVSTKGMTEEEAQRAVEEALAGLGDGFAGMIPGLRALRKDGESMTEALNRLSTSLTGVNSIMDTLGHDFHAAGLAGADAASRIAEAFGGLDAMASATQRFYSAFYTEQERIEVTTRQTTEALARLGIAMPRTRDQYRAMVASLNLTTEAGREAYAALIGMADAFDMILPQIGALTEAMAAAQDAVRTGLDGAIGAAQEAAKANATAAGNWYKAAGSIREYIDKLRGAASALFSPAQAMRYNRQQYQQTYRRALNGDLGAAQAVTGAADRYLSSVMDTARTREEAALAQARVLSQMGLLQGVADIEGARHDVIAGLIGQQVTLLTEARDFLAAGGVMTADMIRTLRTGLGSIDGAVRAAQQISWSALQRQLNVTVGIIADADVPPHVRTLLANATNGVRGFVDFVARSDLTPDQKWMALTNASGHLKTVRFLAQNDMPETYTRLALRAGNAYRVSVTTQIESGSALNAAQLQRLFTGSADGRITLGGSFRFDPSAGFATWYETASRAAIQTPMVALRTAMGTLQTALTALRAAIIAPPPAPPPARPVTPTTPTAPVAPRPRPQITTAQQQYSYNTSEGPEYATRTVYRVGGREFRTRQAAEEWVNSNYPAFAKGGTHKGGPAIIAENAPELVAPSKIYNGSQTRAMLDNSGVVRELQRVRAELAEMKAHARRAAEAGVSTEKLMRKADALGVKIDPDQNKVTT